MTTIIKFAAAPTAPTLVPVQLNGGRVHLFVEGDYQTTDESSAFPRKGELPLCERPSVGLDLTHPKVTQSAIYTADATANFVGDELRFGHTHQTHGCKGCAKAYVKAYGEPTMTKKVV